MNEHQLGRLLRRVIMLSAPLPLAMLGAACGGSALDPSGAGGASAGTGSAAGSGAGGSRAGAGAGGASAGTGSAAGTGAVAGTGTGGSGTAGSGTAGSGTAGSGTAGSGTAGSGTGGSGTAGSGTAGSGTAGWASGGAGGGTNGCKGAITSLCSPATISVPVNCIGDLVIVGMQLPEAQCTQLCNGSGTPHSYSCRVLTVESGGAVSLSCSPGCAVGRRPAGFEAKAHCDPSAMGDYFAEVARLEAASVTAFRILRDELREQGAPKRLVRAAARAARDEVRHARSTGALARRFAGQPRMAPFSRGARRSLEAMAIENAVEGCVRETYGALVATRQAEYAKDPHVRAAMMRIARDETRHAALSWSVAHWLDSRLDTTAKRNVERAKLAAARELTSSIANEAEPSFADLAGLPSRAEASALAAQLERALWS